MTLGCYNCNAAHHELDAGYGRRIGDASTSDDWTCSRRVLVVPVCSDPRDVAAILELSRATYGKMIQNLLWATGYNVVTIPLAAGVAYAAGVTLTPAAGAALMSISTVIVAVNARLLGRRRMA